MSFYLVQDTSDCIILPETYISKTSFFRARDRGLLAAHTNAHETIKTYNTNYSEYYIDANSYVRFLSSRWCLLCAREHTSNGARILGNEYFCLANPTHKIKITPTEEQSSPQSLLETALNNTE